MSSNDHDPPDSSPDRMDFKTVDTVSIMEKSLSEVLSCVLQHEESGIPLVIVGLSADPNWSPFPQMRPSEVGVHGDGEGQYPGTVSQSLLNAERQSDHTTDRNLTDEQQGPFAWASGLSLVPKYLLPPGPRETFSMMVEDSQNEADLSGTGTMVPPPYHQC